jgi:endonuclease YncB( thermonuclease family)
MTPQQFYVLVERAQYRSGDASPQSDGKPSQTESTDQPSLGPPSWPLGEVVRTFLGEVADQTEEVVVDPIDPDETDKENLQT